MNLTLPSIALSALLLVPRFIRELLEACPGLMEPGNWAGLAFVAGALILYLSQNTVPALESQGSYPERTKTLWVQIALVCPLFLVGSVVFS